MKTLETLTYENGTPVTLDLESMTYDALFGLYTECSEGEDVSPMIEFSEIAFDWAKLHTTEIAAIEELIENGFVDADAVHFVNSCDVAEFYGEQNWKWQALILADDFLHANDTRKDGKKNLVVLRTSEFDFHAFDAYSALEGAMEYFAHPDYYELPDTNLTADEFACKIDSEKWNLLVSMKVVTFGRDEYELQADAEEQFEYMPDETKHEYAVEYAKAELDADDDDLVILVD